MIYPMRICSIVGILVLGIAGCRQSSSAAWNSADPTFIPYPVFHLVVSADNRFAAAQLNEKMEDRNSRDGRATYILDLKTGQHRRFDPDTEFMTFSDHKFVKRGFSISSEPIVVIDGLVTQHSFAIGSHAGGWRNSKSDDLIFETGRIQVGEGFTELSILNPVTGAVHRVPTQQSDSIGFCSVTGNFYTEHNSGADEFDAGGNFIRTIPSPLGLYSSGCNFVVPFGAVFLHGPVTWGIYEANHFNKLVEYPWTDDNSDLHWFQSWNPTQDNLILIRTSLASAAMKTSDVVDVRGMKVIQSWPWPDNPNEPPTVWSGDGMAIATVRDHHIVFDPISH